MLHPRVVFGYILHLTDFIGLDAIDRELITTSTSAVYSNQLLGGMTEFKRTTCNA